MELMNTNGIVLNLNIQPYTNILIPLDNISPEVLEEIDTKIEIAKQIVEKHSDIKAGNPERNVTSYADKVAPDNSQTTSGTAVGGDLKVNFGEVHEVQVSKYVKLDTSGQYSYHIYEVIEKGVIKTLKASDKLHEALSTLTPDEVVKIDKVKKTNRQGREYQTYRVVKSDGTTIL